MEQDRLTQLENLRDWQGLVEELEKSIATRDTSSADKASYHLRLGRILHEKFLSGVKALKHFQDAYKLNPQLLESLDEARHIYWELGKQNMVQKLLELSLKTEQDGERVSALLLELGDVLCDAGDYDRATATYARSLSASSGANVDARGRLEDVQVESGTWKEHTAELVRLAASTSAEEQGKLYLRAARIARRFAPEQVESMLESGYRADPTSVQAAALYEGLLADGERLEELEGTQAEILGSESDRKRRATMSVSFGSRWIARHQKPEIGAQFLEDAVKLDPAKEGAFQYLREVHGRREGDWQRVVTLAEEAAEHAGENGAATFLLSQAATILWRNVGDLMRARASFERLSVLAPDHPQLRAFEAQIGEPVSAKHPSIMPGALTPSVAPPALDAATESAVAPAAIMQSEPPPASAPSTARSAAEAATAPVTVPPPSSVNAAPEPTPAPASVAPPTPPPSRVAPPAAPSEPGSGDVEQLKAQAAKQEGAKRFNEYVKTLLQLAAVVPDPEEKVSYLMKAADLYVSKFANQAEAVKAYEQVLALEPENDTAIEYLRQMYEKRRDWEKLLGLERKLADSLVGDERAARFLQIAKMATERVKKPEVCIDLWNEVLQAEPANAEALAALAQLYERSKDYDKLAEVLEQQVEITYDNAARVVILTKLGTLYGDRLNNDEGAVTAWRALLAIEPGDRKAQEALKKKYLALAMWDELEVFYAESGKWDEFIRVLEQQEAKETDVQAKIGLLFKIADLWADKKQKNDRAARAYEKVLELDESNLRAAEALIPIYQAANNPKALANAIEVKLGHEEDDVAKVDLLREVASLYEGKVKEPEKALERYLSAFALAPSDERSADDVERSARVAGAWDKVIAAYNEAVDGASGDRDLGVTLRLRQGRVLLDELTRVDEALSVYRAVYEADSENEGALAALERLYRQTGKFGELLEVYEKKRELTGDADDKKRIQYEIAKLYETELRDVDRAIETYNAVLEEDPNEGAALAALDKLYGDLARWEPYVETLRRRIELDVGEGELIDLKFRLGQTLETHLEDAAGALENYREILFVEPDHQKAREALEALLENDDLKADAAAILESIYEERSDWAKLARTLEILSQSETEPRKRVQIERKIARIASEHLGDKERAFKALSLALKDDPSLDETRLELQAVAESALKFPELAALYAEIAEELSDAQLARTYWMRTASIHDDRLDQVDQAAAGYVKVLGLDARDEEALSALEALFARTERWSDLIGVIERRIEQASDATVQENLYVQIAQIQDVRLGKLDEAANAYRKVLELDPTSQSALTALDQLFVRQELWAELADNLEAQLALAPNEQAEIQLMLRLAALREQKMGEIEVAIEGYRQVLERDLHNAPALEALERLGRDAAHELTIADLLEPLYRQLGNHEKLIAAHEVQVRRAEDSPRRVDLLHAIAQLYEDAAGNLDAAFQTLSRALKEDPSSEPTQVALDRVARATNRHADLAGVFETLGAELSAGAESGEGDTQLASTLYMMSARVYEEDLRDADRAAAHYRTVLGIDPTYLSAAEALERLFRITERWSELSQILQQKSEILDDLDDKKTALFQAASLEEDVLERPQEAIAVYKKILEQDGEELRALDALIRRYLGLSAWTELLDIYSRKVDLVLEPEEKKRIYYQVGAVYEQELHDVPRAIDTYNRILELDPDDLQALSRLDVLYEQAQNWTELLGVLQRESEMTGDAAEAISFRYRIAELYEKRLDDVARAVELYRDILQEENHQPTLAALEGLKDGTREPLAAAAVLEPVYEASSDWARLVSVHEVQVKYAEDEATQVELLHRIARIQEEAQANLNAAFDTMARALIADNGNEDTLASLERLANFVSRWPEVAQLYDGELDKLAENPDRFVELGLRVAQIFEIQLDDVENAIVRYRRVSEVAPADEAALTSLDRLYQQTGRWAELAEVLAREAELDPGAEQTLSFQYRLGQLREKQLGDLDGAISAYRTVLEANPEHVEALAAVEALFAGGIKQMEIAEILDPLYTGGNEWLKLAGVYEARLANTDPSAEGGAEARLEQYYAIADLYESKLVDYGETLRVYLRALKEAPLDERAGEEAPRLSAGVDAGFETLANAYADILGTHEAVTVQRSIGGRLARTFEEELGDVQRAEETYAYVLGVDPTDADALVNLDRIHSASENWPELANILEMRVKAPVEEHELVELYARLGEVYETQLVDIPRATLSYRRIFDELEKTHEGAIAALARIYESQGAWQELNVVYERELENAPGQSDEADIRAKLAHLASERLGDGARAVDVWKLVLDLRGEDPEALGALANLYEQQEAWRELVDVLERQCDIAMEDDERVNILTRRARVFTDKLGRDDMALDDWNRVLDIDFANLAALRAVAAIRRRQNEPGELTQSLHMTVDRAASFLEPEELKEVFRELGKTYGERLEQPFDAAEAWRKLLEIGPDFEAFDALEAIYRSDERWTDVIDVKMQRADALSDVAEKIAEYKEAAALWLNPLAEADGPTPAWQRVLEADPAHDEAYLELEKLHIAAGRWEPLIELYLGRLDTREDEHEQTELLRKIAHVFEEKLDDKNQALDALVNALQIDIFDRETAKYLEKMAHETRRWSEVIQTVSGWLKSETDAKRKIRLCLLLAKWYGDDLNRPDYAQPMYAQIVQLDPDNVGALRQMAQLYKKAGNFQQYGTTLTRALDVALGDVEQKEILNEIGELLEQQMKDEAQAVSYYKRALQVDGHFLPALENLERIYSQRGENRELVDILLRKAPALTVTSDVVTTKIRIGGLYESQVPDAPRAAVTYAEVLQLDPVNLQAMRGLSRSYERLERWPELITTLEGELEVVTNDSDRIVVLMHLATLHEEKFLKADQAAARLEQLLEIDPNHEEAYFAIERNYRKMRSWEALIGAYERHISATLDKSTKVDLYSHIAGVYADELDDADRGIDAYRNMIDLDENHVPALEALAKLYDKQGDAPQAVDYMTRVADLTVDGKQKVESYYRIGKMLDEKLGDRVSAQDKYELALDLEPSHILTLQALRQISLDNADYDKAARYIDQEQSYTTAPRQRARLLVELGRLREEMLQDHDSAVMAWEAGYEADPENEDAALPLADEYITTEQWERAEPLLDLLTRKAGKRDRIEQHDLNAKLGVVATMLGKDDKALKAYAAAHQLDLTNRETIRGLAEVSFRLRDWASALTNFQKVLTSLDEDDVEGRADVYYKLGCIKREQGQPKQAINNFEKALGVLSNHLPTLEALVAIYTELKDWKQVVAYRRNILDDVVDGPERFRMLVEIGDIWADNDKNPKKALEAYEEARDVEPSDLPLLNKLLTLYPQVENWASMIDTLQAMSEMEKDPARKSKFVFTMAQLYRDKEQNLERAVELFNDSLDLNPTFLEAFERINKTLTGQKDWKQLERSFRKMLRRLSSAKIQNTDLEWNLWHGLGLIYRDRLQDISSAVECFKMSVRQKPDDPVERQILAELFEVSDQVEAAMGEHWHVLEKDPMRVEPYRNLYRLALKLHDYDRAWTLCAALSFLGKADEDERRFFDDYRPRSMVQVKSRLDNEMWVKSLFHREENVYIGKIFEMVTPAAIVAKTQMLARAKQLPVLDPRYKQDPANSTVTFAKTFGWAAQVLGVPQPDLYVRNDVAGALVAVPSAPPASVAGQTVLTGFSPQELTFIIGKHLSNYRGEHYIKSLFPTLAELKVVLFAAIKIILADFNVPPDMAQAVNSAAMEFAKGMRPIERDSLRIVVQKFVDDGARADLKRWMQTVEVTAARAGLLLCGDLDIAKKIIAAEPQLPGDLTPPEKMKELLIFSVSDHYLKLRKSLGINVESAHPGLSSGG